jgi:hypothetical protein
MSIQIMTRVWQDSAQQGSSLVILLAIADFANDQGVAYPSVATLAQKARISESQVHWILRKLVDTGELTIKRQAGPHRCNLYAITDSRVLSSEGAAGNNDRVLPVAPDPSIEPSLVIEASVPSEPSASITPQKVEVDEPFREKMRTKFGNKLTDIDDRIDECLAYPTTQAKPNKQLTVQGWLRRAVEYTPPSSARSPQRARRVEILSEIQQF